MTFSKKEEIQNRDFLSLPNANENLLWNPDLLILGAQSYNSHPETGMISVTDAYHIVRRWNAKECYIVHYSGLVDFEEASNQWFRAEIAAINGVQPHNKIATDFSLRTIE